MEIIRLSDIKDNRSAPPAILCLGNFDGVHIAHKALIDEAKRIKNSLLYKDKNTICGVFTFIASPSAVLPGSPPPRITDFDEKARLIALTGVDILYAAEFGDIRNMTPAEFTQGVLQGMCNCVHAVCGFNFRYGVSGSGTPQTLAESMSGRVSVVDPVMLGGVTVSSTAIRRAVSDGDMEGAAAMLGRNFSLDTAVIHGYAVGNKIGFATANQSFPDGSLIPLPGIYVSYCVIDSVRYPSVTYIGKRPTFGGADNIRCETHAIGYEGNLYGKTVKTEFLKYLGPDQKYETPQLLAEAIRGFRRQALDYTEALQRPGQIS